MASTPSRRVCACAWEWLVAAVVGTLLVLLNLRDQPASLLSADTAAAQPLRVGAMRAQQQRLSSSSSTARTKPLAAAALESHEATVATGADAALSELVPLRTLLRCACEVDWNVTSAARLEAAARRTLAPLSRSVDVAGLKAAKLNALATPRKALALFIAHTQAAAADAAALRGGNSERKAEVRRTAAAALLRLPPTALRTRALHALQGSAAEDAAVSLSLSLPKLSELAARRAPHVCAA